MNVYFNHQPIPGILSCTVKRAARNTRTDYNSRGDMLIDFINRKHLLTLHLGGLDSEQLYYIFSFANNPYISVTFDSPMTELTTANFFLKEQVAETNYVLDGITYYKAFKLVLEEL
ncbi:MAG: hypothetical protein FWH20_00260 [Oscillospiraceae bacterium]|nr:hypothetical protein [Oscillospiraceae bacterium]